MTAGRPKSEKGQTPTIIRTIAIPADEIAIWDEFKRLCRLGKTSMSKELRDMIMGYNERYKKRLAEILAQKKSQSNNQVDEDNENLEEDQEGGEIDNVGS